MNFEAGITYELKVAKEVAPHGYFVTDGNEEVLLHYSEVVGSIKPGDMVKVFMFYDTQDRLASTMKKPLIELGEIALLEVVDIHPRFGSFLEMGLGRNLLLPFREQPDLRELRPQVGDKVYVVLAHDRQGRLLARVAGEPELKPKCFDAPTSWKNTWVRATVYKPLQMGTFVVCDGGVVGFGVIGMIHSTERTRNLRLGEQLDVRISFVREDGNVNCSMKVVKEIGRDEDSEMILAFLRDQNGSMPYSDASSAESINERFQISKSAFKRAIGKLMREGLVYQDGSTTHLKPQAEEGEGVSVGKPEGESGI
ncbi:CvfB family protein [Paenibacillus agricola]|uniref:RNA-binding protein n=1 Tax=Paenibacillus agricola TaxID=2716264 RepID=A0ABX0J731_9BACL|nr:S1-like domain-containing RNA-binding protein [Paenibacillus agricola]NHN30979.1 RNA-binding protein [Paenibacillus agricola]